MKTKYLNKYTFQKQEYEKAFEILYKIDSKFVDSLNEKINNSVEKVIGLGYSLNEISINLTDIEQTNSKSYLAITFEVRTIHNKERIYDSIPFKKSDFNYSKIRNQDGEDLISNI